METERSHNVVVEANPRFAPEHSDPKQGRWIFIYRIRIENQSEGPIRVLVRHWEIVDADGDRNIIDDEGVVGCQGGVRKEQVVTVFRASCDTATSKTTL